MLRIGGILAALAIALLAMTFTALLLVSAWNAFRDELTPGFRIARPGARSLLLTLLGLLLPLALIAAFTTYLAIWLLGMSFTPPA